MTKRHFEMLAKFSREQGGKFKSNGAHAKFVSELATELAQTNPLFDHARFIMASMPSWMVGTRHSNVWERLALKAASPMFAHGKGLANDN